MHGRTQISTHFTFAFPHIKNFLRHSNEYIPQILARAQKLVLKHREQETECEIIKASAQGLINTLLSEGRISLRRKAAINCPAPNRIEVILDDSTKWLCTSLDELKGLVLRRYGTK